MRRSGPSPSPRAALLVAAIAMSALVIAPPVAGLAALVLLGAAVVDAYSIRQAPRIRRSVPSVLSRGVPARLLLEVGPVGPGRVLVRQPLPPDLSGAPREAEGGLDASITALRRGRHRLPEPATRRIGALGLARWDHRPGDEAEVLVYPDLVNARRLTLAVRQGRMREVGQAPRGPLGLGTEFESVRDYLPDDDIRQVNWRATARLDRPMSNQFRIEREREIVFLLDQGRLMRTPVDERHTRMDAALDAVAAVALVADELGDRCGAISFDDAVRRRLRPRRGGGHAVVRALFDLEASGRDSDYELAFRTVRGTKRAMVLVLTDLLEEAAARPLVSALHVLARRHAVLVASAIDPDLDALQAAEPRGLDDVYAASVAVEVLSARARAARSVRSAGADVLEAAPGALAAACVSAYLRAKARARL